MQGEISAGGLIIGGIIGQRGAPGNGIVSITLTGSSGLEDTYTILYTNGDTETFIVTNGAEGNGIVSITKTSSVGLVDTYTILYTNGSSDTIEVHNGEKGDKGDKGDTGLTPDFSIGSVTKGADASATITGTTNNPVLNLVLPKGDKGDKGDTGNTGATGVGIYSITKTGTADLVDTYTILYTNGDTQTYTITNGAKGDTGATGNGIATITKTGTAGLVDTYTITYTNGDTDTFDVTNGADGNVTDVQVEGVSVVDNGVANITGLATQEELDYYKTIYNVLPKITGNGESITLDNTGESILKLDLKGNTSQYSTTGKNLINVEEEKTFTQLLSIDCNIPAGTYHITNLSAVNSLSTNSIVFKFYDNNVSFVLTSGSDITKTLSGTETKIYIYSNGAYSESAGISATIKQLMVSLNGGDYEPYTNGASPNPTYPQPINVVSGDNTITISNSDNTQSQTYPISLGGQNLFDSSYRYNGTISSNGTATEQNGTFSLTSTTQDVYFWSVCGIGTTYSANIGYLMEVNEGETYYFKATNSNFDKNFITTYDSSKVSLGFTQKGNSFSYTIPSGVKYISFRIGISNATIGTTYTTSVIVTNDDRTPLELCKIGDYQDYFYKDSGKWYLHKEIGKVVLDGTENISLWSTIQTGYKRYGISKSGILATQDGKSNYFIYYGNQTGQTQEGSSICITDDYITVKIEETLASNVNNFKTWLGNHNTTLYYALGTATNTQITDNALIPQLNNIQNALSYEGQTNIGQVNNDKPFIISATALRSMLDYGDE